MIYDSKGIRNIAICGHGGTGKTSLTEQLLFQSGSIPKPELVETGRTISDFGEDEISHKISVHTSLTRALLQDVKINILDCPGSSDFIGDTFLALRATEAVIIVVDGKSGVQIETIKLWRILEELKKPRFFFISKLDDTKATYIQVLADIKEKLQVNLTPITEPIDKAGNFSGVLDLLFSKVYFCGTGHDKKEEASAPNPELEKIVNDKRIILCEAAAEGDDLLMARYFENGQLSEAEIIRGLHMAFAEAKIFPCFSGSSLKNCGMSSILNFICTIAPNPLQAPAWQIITSDSKEDVIITNPEKPFSGFIFKTQIDQFSGKLSFVKVKTGKLTLDLDCINTRDGHKERIGKIYLAQGKKLEEVKEICAGDLGVIAKLPLLKTNDTLSTWDILPQYLPIKLPTPVHQLSITAANKKEEDKLNELLGKVTEEDLTFQVHFNPETKETVIAGMGDLHINLILEKIKNATKIIAETKAPRVAYRETITKKASAEYTHKKQSGGHGQYGRVVLEIEPGARGSGYKFENKIFGGAISKNYMPGIEKGIHQAMEGGVLASYPVVDVKIAVTDGKEHPVDSSEMSFKLAARGAFKEASRLAGPILLEPIMNLKIFVEDKNLGDVMSDLSSRRGRISGQVPIGKGIVEIDGQVPQAELLHYAIELRAITSGTGSFEVAFDHYAPISGKLAEDVIKTAQEFKIHAEADD